MGKNTGCKVIIRSHLIVRPSLRRAQPRRGARRVEVSGSRKRGMQEFEPSGSKRTIRGDLIEERGSHEVWYGGDGPCREATPCFGTQPHCLQVQLARHCLLANEPGASVAPSMAEMVLVAKRHLVSAHNLIACRYNWRAPPCWRMSRALLSRQVRCGAEGGTRT